MPRMKTLAVTLWIALTPAAVFAQLLPDVAIAGFTYLPGQEGAFGFARGVTPVKIRIEAGQDITAINLDPAPPIAAHTITSTQAGLFDSGEIATGESVVVDTSQLDPGEYPFFCTNHIGLMFGVLEVVATDDGGY